MKINDITITNWKAPGTAWWASVEAKPDESLIEGIFRLTLSWNEYQELISKSQYAEQIKPATMQKQNYGASSDGDWNAE